MGTWSIMHWMVVLLIVLLLFGAGKIPRLMGDVAKGVKAFKAGMREEDETSASNTAAPKVIASEPAQPSFSQATHEHKSEANR